MEQDKDRRILLVMALVALAGLVACLVPLLLISRYNHSFADDWFYAVQPHLALDRGEGLLGALKAAADKVAYTYDTWQGTYSAIFVMAMMPGVFGEQFYVLAAPIVLALLVGSNFFLSKVALGELLHQRASVWLTVAAVVSTVQLLCQQSPVEGIYWYNAAVYYTGYHGLAQIMAALLLRLVTPNLPRGKRKAGEPRSQRMQIALSVGCALLSAFLAGGNFVTMVECAEGIVILIVFLVLLGKRKEALYVVPSLVTALVGVAISLAAPGNSARATGQFEGQQAGVVGTLTGSLFAAVENLGTWIVGFALVGALALVPLAIYAAKRNHLSYRAPWLATIGCLGVFYSCYTPTFWGMGYVGPGRCQNIRYDFLVVILVINVFWWAGWIVRRRQAKLAPVGPAVIDDMGKEIKLVAGLFAAAMAFGIGMVGYAVATPEFGMNVMPVSAARSLADGEAVEYDAQVWRRYNYLETTSETDVEVALYTAGPKVLFMGDVRDDPNNYINWHLAQWFYKSSLIGVHGNP